VTADALIEVLIAQIDAGNEAWVDALLAKALQKIADGGGMIAPLTGTGLNGKNFNREVRLDAVQVAQACQLAKAHACGNDVSSTSLDFSGLLCG
jgi:hypothetical protein